MRYFALATDYDGTLAHDGVVDDATIAALDRLRESGRRLLMVTGREMRELAEIFPQLELFDWVVAENGAVLYRPSKREEKLLVEPPPASFLLELTARGVNRISVGRGIVATWVPYESAVLGVIRDLGLDLQVIFNKGAVMVLPTGVNKASGLLAVLREMKLSVRNVVGIGDAENDLAMLKLCECSAAVSNALPTVKAAADVVMAGDHGAGVVELIDRMIATDLKEVEPSSGRREVPLGTLEDDQPVYLPPHGLNVMLAGTSGGGKSTLATGLIERLMEPGYQICLFDPEGDYDSLPNLVTIGDSKRPPTIPEILQLLERPEQSCIVNLLGVAMEHRPEFFARLLPALWQLRVESGRPHWLIVDEAHHFFPRTWAPASMSGKNGFQQMMLITVHPDQVARAVLEGVDLLLTIGREPGETMKLFAQSLEIASPPSPQNDLAPGEGIAWYRRTERPPFWFRSIPPKAERHRHKRKYAEGEIDEPHVFYFRGPEGKLKLRAQNLMIFLQLADGVDDETWLFHLRNGGYADWFRESLGDDELALEAEAIAAQSNLTPEESRQKIRQAVESRYTSPS